MQDDTELLRRYLELRSEAAFASLVERHLGLVYSTAVRRVGGDAQLAQDVAQTVFIDLARKAGQLRHRTSLTGWLYTSTQLASAAVVRREQRRKNRELAYTMENALSPQEPQTDWAKIRPVLDDAMADLREEDREAVLLRFFQQRSFAEVGAALRLSEEAARKRVERALEQLRTRLGKLGVVSTTSALTTALSAATAGAPAALTTTITQAAVHSAASTAATSMVVTLAKVAVPATAALALGTWFVSQENAANAALRDELHQLSTTPAQVTQVRAENLSLRRQLSDFEKLKQDAAELPSLRRLAGEQQAAAVRKPATVAVTADGRLRWGDEYVTLNRFLHELKVLAAQSPENAALVIRSEGASFNAFSYPVEEARKIGISHVVIERDGDVDPKLGFSWF